MKCIGQNYSWGKQAQCSLVAKIIKENKEECDDSKRYAEYWMGSHINGPSSLYDSNNKLHSICEYINGNKSSLDYLFKVLSIDKPLSIQLHPNKTTSEQLHKDFPSMYKDPNHKPEMFIAISDDFELLFGFKPIQDAIDILLKLPSVFNSKEANDLIANHTEDSYKAFISSIVNLSSNQIEIMINEIVKSYNDDLTLKLYNECGNDLGVIVSMFMNHIKCKRNNSMFILPNIPHAYIKGECFEIMANSDNVIRLGLTPKKIDKENFNMILRDKFNDMVKDPNTVSDTLVITKGDNNSIVYYNPLFKEFKLENIKLDDKANKEMSIKIQKESIVFVFKGKMEVNCTIANTIDHKTIKELECYYIQYDSILQLKSLSDYAEIYIASSNEVKQ